jgi:hypothetical protein
MGCCGTKNLQPIEAPEVPCVIPISGVKLASRIYVSGIPFNGTNKYLCIELFARHDIALCIYAHFGPERMEMTLNSCIGGIWQNEGRIGNPFVIGKPFKMKIKNTSTYLKVGLQIYLSHHPWFRSKLTENVFFDIHIDYLQVRFQVSGSEEM